MWALDQLFTITQLAKYLCKPQKLPLEANTRLTTLMLYIIKQALIYNHLHIYTKYIQK
jgi:hypothetical protein